MEERSKDGDGASTSGDAPAPAATPSSVPRADEATPSNGGAQLLDSDQGAQRPRNTAHSAPAPAGGPAPSAAQGGPAEASQEEGKAADTNGAHPEDPEKKAKKV